MAVYSKVRHHNRTTSKSRESQKKQKIFTEYALLDMCRRPHCVKIGALPSRPKSIKPAFGDLLAFSLCFRARACVRALSVSLPLCLSAHVRLCFFLAACCQTQRQTTDSHNPRRMKASRIMPQMEVLVSVCCRVIQSPFIHSFIHSFELEPRHGLEDGEEDGQRNGSDGVGDEEGARHASRALGAI